MFPKGRPHVLGIGSPKGGVGKTTTAVTLAHLASLNGQRVLLVDADENLSAHDWALRAGDHIDVDLATEREGKNLIRLHDLTDYDLIVVDLPGVKSSEAFSALLHVGERGTPVVDALVVPAKVETLDQRAVLRVILEVLKPAGIPYLLVGTMVGTASMQRARRDLADIAKDSDIAVAETVIRELIAHADSVAADRPITAMPGGQHSTVRAAEREYRALAEEVFTGLLKLPWHNTAAPQPETRR